MSKEPVRAPACGEKGCTNPARFEYKQQNTCSAGPYYLHKERCEDHPLHEYEQNPDQNGISWEWRKVHNVRGKRSTSTWWKPWTWDDYEILPLEMDPHYYCKWHNEPGRSCVDDSPCSVEEDVKDE